MDVIWYLVNLGVRAAFIYGRFFLKDEFIRSFPGTETLRTFGPEKNLSGYAKLKIFLSQTPLIGASLRPLPQILNDATD